MNYTAPTRDMRFILEDIVNIGQLRETRIFEDLSADLIDAVLTEAGRLAAEVIAPTNRAGDEHGSRLMEDGVKAAPGFAKAYAKFVEGGWGSIACDPGYGGQGLPYTLSMVCQEMIHSANLAFGLCPLLTSGAVEAVAAHGTPEIKETYLPKMISGEWTGTMNLTESNAGSDLGLLRAKAEPQGDGSYLIRGTKIFITWGDHDIAENIIHLVLARLPDAPEGTRGISLFLVPKYLVNEDGSLGARNDVKPIGLEHKLGIHGSPTCIMAFGEEEGAIGYLIGTENKGLACMFTMMNAERLSVGLQGAGMIERAYQQALAYAQGRKQGKPWSKRHETTDSVAIIEHPDVRRMLLTMKAHAEACRAICYANAMAIDLARHAPDSDARQKAKSREELLTPISKAFSTDMGVEMTSIGVQIHGGMGFVEETGAAQHFRDVRITPIYEGTNGIQAIDLATRKLSMGGGAAVREFIAEAGQCADDLVASSDNQLGVIGSRLKDGVDALNRASDWMLSHIKDRPEECLAGATPYLRLFGTVAGGHYLGLGALAAQKHIEVGSSESAFYSSKISIAKFYAENVLPLSEGYVAPVTSGVDALYELSPDQLAG